MLLGERVKLNKQAFEYDVFINYSSQDMPVVRAIAERLRNDGLKVWFDQWEINVGDNRSSRIEDGLEQSRVLILCMSINAYSTGWAQLEASTFRFRDPLNTERHLIPLRLDNVSIEGPLAQYSYHDWHEDNHDSYTKLFQYCRPPASPLIDQMDYYDEFDDLIAIHDKDTLACSISPDKKYILSGGADATVRIRDINTKRLLSTLRGHTGYVWTVAWSSDQRYVLSGGTDRTIRIWDLKNKRCLHVLEGHDDSIATVSWSPDNRYAISCSGDGSVRLWDVESGSCLKIIGGKGNSGTYGVAMSTDQRQLIVGYRDATVRLWDVDSGRCLRILEGHTGQLRTVAWCTDQRYALTAGEDRSLRLWDLVTGQCLRILKGHEGYVWTIAWGTNKRFVLSGSGDKTARLWDLVSGDCIEVLRTESFVRGIAWGINQRCAYLAGGKSAIIEWDIASEVIEEQAPEDLSAYLLPMPNQVLYTNAKVLLVGESGAGKTGLSTRIAMDDWQPSDSTVGAWATQWKLPISFGDGIKRDIWLWDFGGQADQRLIHQLYMDETALVILVFDGQKDDLFETLGQWDRDLTRASRNDFEKLLVAGRVDAGGLRISRSEVDKFVFERKYRRFLETSAKTGLGCEELKRAILSEIKWDQIPCRTTQELFKRLQEMIIRLKDSGRVLMRYNELRETLRFNLIGEDIHFTDEDLKTVIRLLTGPGVVWELEFGSWVLLQPERINAYAQAVIQTLRDDTLERGCLSEEKVLCGNLKYNSSLMRLDGDEERFVLLAMHQMLVGRGLCLREQTDNGTVLVFPSYYRRERPELVGHPAVLVSYRFCGFLDDIYATLVVRLHHTRPFQQDQLWHYAADFKTLTGKQLGIKMTRMSEGAGELEVYFDPTIPLEEKIIFAKYVHEHLVRYGTDVIRLRHYVCPHCGTPVGNREVAMRKLAEGKVDIPCINCDDSVKRIPLWDLLEQQFTSEQTKSYVRELEDQSTIMLDNESRERVLVGEVISTVALAGQICREFSISDHGIDMEIEFKDDKYEATGEKIYLQLKSGDSHLYKRKRDGREIFPIKEERHVRYWMSQGYPVLLVIRNAEGDVRWMEISEYLRHASNNGQKRVRTIVFEGERFDVMSVRRMRDKVLCKMA